MQPQAPTLAAVWFETFSQSDLDPQVLAAALRRNTEPRYGLTLVLGCPLPAAVQDSLQALRQTLEGSAPGLIRWVQPDACHLTVYGLKRSRPQPFPPGELDPLLARLDSLLQTAPASRHRLSVPLAGPAVTPQGAVLLSGGGSQALDGLRRVLRLLPGVDPPNVLWDHITLGQFAQPFGSAQAFRQAMDAIQALGNRPGGELVAEDLQLIHYRNRLLEDIACQKTIPL